MGTGGGGVPHMTQGFQLEMTKGYRKSLAVRWSPSLGVCESVTWGVYLGCTGVTARMKWPSKDVKALPC